MMGVMRNTVLPGLVLLGLLGCGSEEPGKTIIVHEYSDAGPNMICVPGDQDACACPEEHIGFQVCADDGKTYGPCTCPMAPPPACTVASDCPGASDCASPACIQGECYLMMVPAGMLVAGQVAGDCSDTVCDGMGQTTTIPNEADIEDDNLSCTVDACIAGETVHSPLARGAACQENNGRLCDGAGACVDWIPVYCVTDNPLANHYVCDGGAYAGAYFVKWAGGKCDGTKPVPVYCPPGTPCTVSVNGGPEYNGLCQ